MNHSYTVKDMSCGMGLRMRYEFKDKNAKGEKITIELVSCTRYPGSRSLPILWEKKGIIDRILDTWVGVNVYVTSEDGTCRGAYNPQESGIGHKINFDWMLEDTPENRDRILAEICRRAFEEVSDL